MTDDMRPETLSEAVELVRAWRDDDGNLPIPTDRWGTALAYAVDLLVNHAEQTARLLNCPTETRTNDLMLPGDREQWTVRIVPEALVQQLAGRGES